MKIYLVLLLVLLLLILSDYKEREKGVDIIDRDAAIVDMSDSNGVIFYLPAGTEPNDYTWRAVDCNEPLRVIDSNGIEFLITPEPFLEVLI